MYESLLPRVDEIVMVQVTRITPEAVFTKLLAYEGREGMIQLSELSRRRIRSIHQLVQVGKVEAVAVLRVDDTRGYIDLSKKHVSSDDAALTEERHMKTRAVHNTLTRVAATHGGGVSLLSLYEAFGWDLYRRFGHAYDAFRLMAAAVAATVKAEQKKDDDDDDDDGEKEVALPDVLVPYASLVPPKVLHALVSLARRMFVSKPLLLRASLELTCFEFNGVEAIREALQAAEATSVPNTMTIVAKLVAPPTYVLVMNVGAGTALTEAQAIAHLDAACAIAKQVLEQPQHKGQCVVREAAHVVNAKDDHVFASLMETLAIQKKTTPEEDEDDEQVADE